MYKTTRKNRQISCFVVFLGSKLLLIFVALISTYFICVVIEDEALSEAQQEHVQQCKKSIEWLVRDEIAAAMRSTGN